MSDPKHCLVPSFVVVHTLGSGSVCTRALCYLIRKYEHILHSDDVSHSYLNRRKKTECLNL